MAKDKPQTQDNSFRAKFPVLEIAVFVCGALVMIYEIIGSRILAPHIGTSTYVWTSLIGAPESAVRELSVMLPRIEPRWVWACAGWCSGSRVKERSRRRIRLGFMVFFYTRKRTDFTSCGASVGRARR